VIETYLLPLLSQLLGKIDGLVAHSLYFIRIKHLIGLPITFSRYNIKNMLSLRTERELLTLKACRGSSLQIC